MKGIKLCAECADYDKKKHRCLRGANIETNAVDPFYDDCPLPDVAPVVHGRWEENEDEYYSLHIVKCSVCREEWCFEVEDDIFDLNYRYCPNCGAKMDG